MIRKSVLLVLFISLFVFIGCEEDCPTEATNNPPTTPVIIASVTTVESGGQISLTATSTDQDNDNLSYIWSATGGSFNTTSNSIVTWTAPVVDNDQTFTITVEVKDGKCGAASASVNILVTAVGGGGGNGVIIGTNQQNSWAPFGGAAETYKITQVLYYANEIGLAGTIKGIATMNSTNNPRDFTNLKIYLCAVNRNSIEANFVDNYDGTSPTLVYQQANFTYGVQATDRDQWHEFNFDTDFSYNGTDNLLVVFERNSPGGGGSAVGVYGFDTNGINRIMATHIQGGDTGIPHDWALHIKLLIE